MDNSNLVLPDSCQLYGFCLCNLSGNAAALQHQEQMQLSVPVGAYNGSAEPRGVESSKCVL